ncbi:hypothetical protein [Herbaspirillum robiniae]|uniref:Double-GTPase 1 domain-containing protein n=1 Tax=Herbaspirillum robiniae TaxID=2014887 RepID=A0A246WR26_9BURK|nr:hypothetical protein [Herbaspirillum robiniae]OWY28835.1 hypothetical protein CEJ42_12750 [Herbaspirillum robiniae]
MKHKSIILVGGPETGKSNYVARLWCSLKAGRGMLQRAGLPENLEYIDSICEHLFQGKFIGRTDTNLARQDFRVPLKLGADSEPTTLLVPDFTGELWRDAIKHSEIAAEWLEQLETANGALLFVRVHSPRNVQPLDWVTSRDLLKKIGQGNEDIELPTQVVLCELLSLLQARLSRRADGGRPRVAVIVTAWDRLNPEEQNAGPEVFLSEQFPLFFGALHDADKVDIRTYGVTIVGGDLDNDPVFRQENRKKSIEDCGWVSLNREGIVSVDADITIPVAWAIGD